MALFVTGAPAPSRADLPPLIPRNVLFGNPEKAAPQISPDGKKLAYLAPAGGVLNIFVKTIGQNDDHAITASKSQPVTNLLWARNSHQIVYSQDKDGNEANYIYCVDLDTGVERKLTHGIIAGAEWAFPDTLIVEDNLRDPRVLDSFRLDLKTGKMEMAAQNPGNVTQWLSDANLQVRAAVAALPDGSRQVLVRDSESAPFRLLTTFTPEDDGGPRSFSKDGKKIFFSSNQGANTKRAYEIDTETGATKLIYAREDVDLEFGLIHPTRKTLDALSYNKFRSKWVVFDPELKADFKVLEKGASGDPAIISLDAMDKTWIVGYSSDSNPVAYYSYNRAAKRLTFLFNTRPQLEKYRLATMKPLEITARDGLKLVSYLSLPVGVPSKKLPMVLLVHGGPWSRDYWGYDSEAQWLANRGYAVLQVNFRGSTGFGKRFINAADREWGGKMNDDLVDAVHWAIGQGIADPKRVAIYGGSYGGFATLTGLTKTPELFACGVDIVGPSNLLTFLRTVPADWGLISPMLKRRVGDLGDEAFLNSRSPVFSADKIVRPLLIAQGANDPRVRQNESDQIVRAIRKNGKDVTYLLFADEGHGFARPVNKLKFYAATEAFLARYLGGRAEAAQAGEEPPLVAPGQEGVAPEVVNTAPAPTKKRFETSAPFRLHRHRPETTKTPRQ